MQTQGKLGEVTVESVDHEDGAVIFDGAARRELGISGEEFLRRWDDGDYEDDDSLAVMKVGMLVPLGR